MHHQPITTKQCQRSISYHSSCRPGYPKILLSVLQKAYVHIFRFLSGFSADALLINQNKTVSKVNISIIHLVRTVCELTSSIIQTYNTRTTSFCSHLRKSFLIEDCRTLSPKAMHHVCYFHSCQRVLNGCCLLRVCFIGFVHSSFSSLVSCSHLSPTASNQNLPHWKMANFHNASNAKSMFTD